jgi:hypothetical protein
MTQTLDIAGRYSQLDSARAAATPAVETQTRSKFGVFAITFGIASTLLYTVFERLNWPLFTYLPRVNRVEFWMYRSPPAESPPMYWYGWIVLAAVAALVVSLIATRVSDQTLRRATFFCCVLGALWPTFLAVLRTFGPDWQALNIEFMNSAWVAAVPALVGTAAITYFVPPQFVQRVWTNLLLIVPIGGLVVLGYSLQQYFMR